MRLDPAPFRPGIGVVMMADIGDQQALAGLVDDQPDVAIDARRPEIRVLALVDAVELETVAGRVHLQIEDARLHRLLVQAGQPVEGGGEGVGDQEVHRHHTPNTFITSSPKWLMTFTAMRPLRAAGTGARCRNRASPRPPRRSRPAARSSGSCRGRSRRGNRRGGRRSFPRCSRCR